MNGETMNTIYEAPAQAVPEQAEPMRWYIPAYKAQAFKAAVAKANGRLDRAWTDADTPAPKILMHYHNEERALTLPSGRQVTRPYVVATLASPLRLTLGGYTFVASLIPEEAGVTVHSAPGQSLEGWTRPAVGDTHCDHCHIDRYRKRLYVIRNDETGELMQIGHTCIELYLGVKPKGLFALTFDDELREYEEDDLDSYGGWGGGHVEYKLDIDDVLATAYVLSDEGRGYISKAKAESNYNLVSTVERVREHIFSPPKPCSPGDRHWQEYKEYRDDNDKIDLVLKDKDLLAAIKASAETLRAGTDYADNMAIILAAESGQVSQRNVGVLASLVAVYARQQGQKAEAKAAGKVQGYLGKVGEKLTVHGTVTYLQAIPTDYGTSLLVILTTDDGHTVKTFGSGKTLWGLATGDVVTATGTVKDHKPYKGTDQTVLKGMKVVK